MNARALQTQRVPSMSHDCSRVGVVKELNMHQNLDSIQEDSLQPLYGANTAEPPAHR